MSEPCQYSFEDVAGIIRDLREQIFHAGPQRSDERRAFEERFDVVLPTDYRRFVGSYGALRTDSFAIFGLGDRKLVGRTVADITFVTRLRNPGFSEDLVPISTLGDGRLVCLDCKPDSPEYGAVFEIDTSRSTDRDQRSWLAACFSDYLYRNLDQIRYAAMNFDRQAWERFEYWVNSYQQEHNYDHAKGGKLPRNIDWRPYRFCIQDVVFGVTVVRHLREGNCLQVDVLLTADIPAYDPLAGAQALASFLLSEAYKCGGTMEVRFTDHVEGGRVPQELQDLAQRHGIDFSKAEEGRIQPAEAKALYVALTDFSPALQTKINDLEAIGQIKMARACYVVHHGVWSRDQVEMIVLGSEYPDSILSGAAQPHQRHRYQHDLLHVRAALLGGMLDRTLALRERVTEKGVTYDLEDDVRALEIDFDAVFYAKRYRSDEAIPLLWLYPDNERREIPGGMTFHVLVRARDAADIVEHLAGDIEQANQLRSLTDTPTFILLPYDFLGLHDVVRNHIQTRAQTAKIGLLICPESLLTFDSEAAQKLARSRVLRQ